MRNVLAEAGKSFEYIIVDLPPLGPIVDVRAAASLFDAFIFIVEWGRTPRVGRAKHLVVRRRRCTRNASASFSTK